MLEMSDYLNLNNILNFGNTSFKCKLQMANISIYIFIHLTYKYKMNIYITIVDIKEE